MIVKKVFCVNRGCIIVVKDLPEDWVGCVEMQGQAGFNERATMRLDNETRGTYVALGCRAPTGRVDRYGSHCCVAFRSYRLPNSNLFFSFVCFFKLNLGIQQYNLETYNHIWFFIFWLFLLTEVDVEIGFHFRWNRDSILCAAQSRK